MESFKQIYELIKGNLPYKKNIKELSYSDLLKSLVPKAYFEEETFLIGGKFMENDTAIENNIKTKIKKEFCISKTEEFLIIEGESKYFIDSGNGTENMISLVRTIQQRINIEDLKDFFDFSEEDIINLLINSLNSESHKLNQDIIIKKQQLEAVNKDFNKIKDTITTIQSIWCN